MTSKKDRKQIIRTLIHRNKELNALREINFIRGSTDNLGILLSKIIRVILKYVKIKGVFALIYRPKIKKLELKATNLTQDLNEEFSNVITRIGYDTIQNYSPIIINRTRKHPTLRKYGIKNLISLPLMVYDGTVGCFITVNKNSVFTKQDLNLLTGIASQSASMLKEIKLTRNLEEKDKKVSHLYKLLYRKEGIKAITDPLTNIYNKGHFVETLEQYIKDKNMKFSLILFDVDFFKNYNDSFGHQAGDKLLKDVAVTVVRETREQDKVCRYGGEEFAVLLPDTELEEAIILAERMRQSIENLYNLNKGNRIITASFGVAQYELGESKENFVNKADKLLYKSKTLGRNRVMPPIKVRGFFG